MLHRWMHEQAEFCAAFLVAQPLARADIHFGRHVVSETKRAWLIGFEDLVFKIFGKRRQCSLRHSSS
jgi:hypothetical protein